MALQAEILKQIDEVLNRHTALRSRSQYDDCSDRPDIEVTSVVTMMCDTIRRFAPASSLYMENMQAILKRNGATNAYVVPHIAGILVGLKVAYESGYLATVTELVHSDLFSDFVEMAEHLLSEGYKDPAAVIIGSVLEEHIRKLCQKHGVSIEISGKPKKADQMNSDLAAGAVYTKLDQKSVTSWLDLRNKAAHGKYTEYNRDQVALYIQNVQNFMIRNPS